MTDQVTSPRLVELAVTDLGMIDHLRLELNRGMTALTGETGAGKTMLVGAIELLLGGRADAALVRPGATEALVEGRFELGDEELVLSRVVPAEGRSRAYVNGRMATAAALIERAGALVDLHGQHAHQSLLSAGVQRDALDEYGSVDLGPLMEARAERRQLEAERASLGGDPGARAREIDLLEFQQAELLSAEIDDPDEDQTLRGLEDRLADAVAHREAAAAAAAILSDDGGAVDQIAAARARIDGRNPYESVVQRLAGIWADLGDAAADLRQVGESIEEDPARLTEVTARRQLLVELRRKYGTAPLPDGSHGTGALGDVIAYREHVGHELDQLRSHDERAAELDRLLEAAISAEVAAAAVVGSRRRSVAPDLARAVEAHLGDLAMAKAEITVQVGEKDPGDDISYLLAANPGLPPGPLSRVASGGELARTMLALRLVVTGAPPILVFDEVDAGIGGDAAVSVGRALSVLGRDHQVLVVTHLPQVAAFADHQVSIHKETSDGLSVMRVIPLSSEDRVHEVARMLAGSHGGAPAREAARELLTVSARARTR